MRTGISKKIIGPQNCVFAFGIPTSRTEYEEWPVRSEMTFTREFFGGWPQYERLVVSIFEDIEPVLSDWGVTIVRGLDSGRLWKLFREAFDVIILFSHWSRDAVELSDGFLAPDAFVRLVPEDFSGLIDLCVCHPDALALSLNQYRPCCLVKRITVKATPGFWLYFYWALFRLLKEEDITYLRALEKIIEMFRKEGRHL